MRGWSGPIPIRMCPHQTHMGSMLGGSSPGGDLCLVPSDSLERRPHAACNSHSHSPHPHTQLVPDLCSVVAPDS